MTDIFATHYADINDAGGRDKLTGLLKDEGLATFSGVTDRASLLSLARGLLTLYLHRDSDPDGVTVITSCAEGRQPGFAGFSSAGQRRGRFTRILSLPRCPLRCPAPVVMCGQ